jgi:hypothetical protein
MFKQLLSGLKNLLKQKEMIVIIIVALVAFALLSYNGSKRSVYDGLHDSGSIAPFGSAVEVHNTDLEDQPSMLSSASQHIMSSPDQGSVGSYDLQPVDDASSLLPADNNSDWAKLNPTVSASATPDLLQAGYHIGLDTIGQTLKNANYQLRSDPIIPKQDTGPWLQSTIEPDLGRVPLEIGAVGH